MCNGTAFSITQQCNYNAMQTKCVSMENVLKCSETLVEAKINVHNCNLQMIWHEGSKTSTVQMDELVIGF